MENTGILGFNGKSFYIVIAPGETTAVLKEDGEYDRLKGLVSRRVSFTTLESFPPYATDVKLYVPQVDVKKYSFTRDQLKAIVHAWNVYLDETPWDDESSEPSFDEWFDKHY